MENGQKLAHYVVGDKLGAGGMGEVWAAEDTKLGRQVAIKVLPEAMASDADRLARFEREARSLAQLNHSNIAAIYGLENDGGINFLVLELVPGETLAERIDRGPVPVADALGFARQIADGMAEAHAAGILHRDLKPANVKVTPDGKVKVLDFGLAKPFQPDPASGNADLSMSPTLTFGGATAAGVLLGTAAYMAPEQARGQVVDRRADVWAFGVVLFEMLTGQRMFAGGTVSDTLASVLKEDPSWDALPADVPPAARRLLRRTLTKDPAKRLHDIADAGLEIDEALTEEAEGIGGEGPGAGKAGGAAPRRGGGLVSLAGWVLFAAAAIALTAALLRPEGAPGRPPVWASIPAPDGTRWNHNSRQPGPPAVSPDGRLVAFAARESLAVSLWVRSLAEEDPRLLAGTEGASYPFWSPDSKKIGFIAEGKLKQIDIVGGTVLTIAEAPFGKSGSWREDGTILFAPSYNSGIMSVDAGGGEPQPVTQLDTQAGENSHRFPQWLPDGRHFLFLARQSGTNQAKVMLGDVQGGTPRLLLHSPTQAQYASSHLLFLRESVLMAQRFDVDGMELQGKPVVVANQLDSILGAARAIYSASEEGTLVFARGRQETNVQLQWFQEDGAPLELLGEPAITNDVRISPDGTQVVATVENPADGRNDVWVFDAKMGSKRRVTFGGESNFSPIWYPDGRRIMFRTRTDGALDLFEKSADGSGESRLVLSTPDDKEACDFSPDGRFLIYQSAITGSGTGFDLYLLPMDGSGEPSLFLQSPQDEEWAMFSPDGKWVAYEGEETGRREVYVVSFPEAGSRIQVSRDGGESPRWASDGKSILFSSPNLEGLLVAEITVGDKGLAAGTPTMVFNRTIPSYGNYDIFDDRVLMEVDLGGDAEPMTLVLDWPALVAE